MLNLIAERKRPLLLLARRINVIGANPFVQVVVVVVVLVLVLVVGRGEVVLRKKERTPEVPSRNHGSWSSGSFELSTAVLIRGWSRVFGEESRSAWELGSGWLAGSARAFSIQALFLHGEHGFYLDEGLYYTC